MTKKTYGCTGCNKTFSRKYNAERHNETIHNQMARIYNNENGWKSKNTKTNNMSQVQQDPFLSPPSTSSILSDIENKNSDNSNNISNHIDNHTTENTNILDSLTSIYSKKEIKGTFKILGKMLPFMDELDSLLLTFDPVNRIDVLSKVIISSLTSPNPVSALKEHTNFFKIVIGIEKASTIISQSQNIPKDAAKIILKSCINTSEYSKNKFQHPKK